MYIMFDELDNEFILVPEWQQSCPKVLPVHVYIVHVI